VSTASRTAICASLVLAALAPAAGAARASGFTYTLERRGVPASGMRTFARIAKDTFTDGRGWSLGGRTSFTRAASGADFRLVLASPEAVTTASSHCSAFYSCRVGDVVLINNQRWRDPPSVWPGSLHGYRHYVVNHEVGHWLGLAHSACPGSGSKAPVMLQQSKALYGCRPNSWPTPAERAQVAAIHGKRPWMGGVCEWGSRRGACGHGHARLGPSSVSPAPPPPPGPEPL
jgi:hypothetical protein